MHSLLANDFKLVHSLVVKDEVYRGMFNLGKGTKISTLYYFKMKVNTPFRESRHKARSCQW